MIYELSILSIILYSYPSSFLLSFPSFFPSLLSFFSSFLTSFLPISFHFHNSSVFLSYLLISFLFFTYIFFTLGGLEISGKVRSKTQDIPSKSVDCVLSVGALGRSGVASTELVTEVYR